ncbi:hypothetical protein [Kocuria rosea]|uniref:hypothetical protein n=1 Tax=Kocuria rosea TaxID=1275 RepID=UPI00203E76C5|nr:hypothetical protein [Kocuria rosea]MCM3688311.1 hypothetical protein [Kocuria rosea]
MDATDDDIETASRELDIDPSIFRQLLRPSPARTVPVSLNLLGGATIYVQSNEKAQDLARSDGAFAVIQAARAAHAGRHGRAAR